VILETYGFIEALKGRNRKKKHAVPHVTLVEKRTLQLPATWSPMSPFLFVYSSPHEKGNRKERQSKNEKPTVTRSRFHVGWSATAAAADI
jgi:hypothetical protein